MSRVLFRHPVCTAVTVPVETREGPRDFLRLKLADWVNVVALTEGGEVVLVRQHRWGADVASLEVPGGIVDPGEAPDVAAARELLEETGYGGGAWGTLGWVWPNPAIQDNRLHVFVARGVRRVAEPTPDAGEELSVELRALAEVRGLLSTGEISHALAVLALQRLLLDQG